MRAARGGRGGFAVRECLLLAAGVISSPLTDVDE
jgi:hypothetical protein